MTVIYRESSFSFFLYRGQHCKADGTILPQHFVNLFLFSPCIISLIRWSTRQGPCQNPEKEKKGSTFTNLST